MEAFVYCWTDNYHNKLYVGWHKGSPDDGYVSSNKELLSEYNNRPGDFTRQVIATGSAEDMYALETAILCSVNASNSEDFYNNSNNFKRGYNGIVAGSKWWTNGKKNKRSINPPGPEWIEGRTHNGNLGGDRIGSGPRPETSKRLKEFWAGKKRPGTTNIAIEYEGVIYATKKEMTEKTGISGYRINNMIKNNIVKELA